MIEIEWFVHHENKCLDINDYIVATRGLWGQAGCSCLAQAANLHSLWSAYTNKMPFCRLGMQYVS